MQLKTGPWGPVFFVFAGCLALLLGGAEGFEHDVPATGIGEFLFKTQFFLEAGAIGDGEERATWDVFARHASEKGDNCSAIAHALKLGQHAEPADGVGAMDTQHAAADVGIFLFGEQHDRRKGKARQQQRHFLFEEGSFDLIGETCAKNFGGDLRVLGLEWFKL
jgi:hypothetical protein